MLSDGRNHRAMLGGPGTVMNVRFRGADNGQNSLRIRRFAALIEIQILGDPEQPAVKACAGLPLADIPDRAFAGFLDQIVGVWSRSGEGQGKPRQGWQQGHQFRVNDTIDLSMLTIHGLCRPMNSLEIADSSTLVITCEARDQNPQASWRLIVSLIKASVAVKIDQGVVGVNWKSIVKVIWSNGECSWDIR